MDPLAAVEHKLRRAGALLVDPRLLRRVIVAHRNMGVGLHVPHTHCYGIRREDLLRVAAAADLGVDPSELGDELVLLGRPPPSGRMRRTGGELLGRFWRSIFHARVHLELERRAEQGGLEPGAVRQRIHHIGQTEFDEIRAILRHDELLLPPYGDREQYIEFAALYLELKHFAPELLTTTFPGLVDHGRVDAVIALDLDPMALLERSCPEGVDAGATVVRRPEPATAAATATAASARAQELSGRMRKPPSKRAAKRMMRRANAAKAQGNDVGSALLYAQAARTLEPAQLDDRIRADLHDLSGRLNAALSLRSGVDPEIAKVQWGSLLRLLVDEAALWPGRRYRVEARLLYDLQLAAVAHERPQSAVDLAAWAWSRGKKPVVRPLPATREVRIARYLRDAAHKVRHTRLDSADRKLLARMLRWAQERADRNVRLALRPAITAGLAEVGLLARTAPEQIAQAKLVEELLDQIVDRGFTTFAHLRDAISRNQLKLDDLDKARELWVGDELLRLLNGPWRAADRAHRAGTSC